MEKLINDKVNILLVDDKPSNLLVLEETLHELGENLVTAGSGKEALKLLLEQEFAVIILDVAMPDMDGYETASLIRSNKKLQQTPIIFLTALNKSDAYISKGYSVGAVDYLFKPFVPEILRAKVEVFAELFKMRRELKQKSEELERSNTELQQFAYVASHDLQEPLRKIKSFTELLADRYKNKLDEKADKYIGYIVDGATRMQGLIQDILSLSRVNTRVKMFKGIQSVHALQQALANLQFLIEKNHATIEYATLPAIVADDVQIIQLFQNLIGNAIKFHGKESPRILISTERKNGAYIFSIKDNGIGIEPQYFDRIFAIFQRLHSRQEYSGSGIGLAICKKIVERHGGRIWVESESGKGSTFFFTLQEA